MITPSCYCNDNTKIALDCHYCAGEIECRAHVGATLAADAGVCDTCNKVKRVCQADGCIVTEEAHSNNINVTVQDSRAVSDDGFTGFSKISGAIANAESATVTNKCGRSVNSQIDGAKCEKIKTMMYSKHDDLTTQNIRKKINEIVFAVNELAEKMNREEQSK